MSNPTTFNHSAVREEPSPATVEHNEIAAKDEGAPERLPDREPGCSPDPGAVSHGLPHPRQPQRLSPGAYIGRPSRTTRVDHVARSMSTGESQPHPTDRSPAITRNSRRSKSGLPTRRS